ncbi:MAG: AIR synthase-related protein, partial [Alphaproteobacteria bacterium]
GGGLLVAIAEMALAGGIGATVALPKGAFAHAWLFGEDQARYVLTTPSPDATIAAARKAGVPVAAIGTTGGAALTVAGEEPISLGELRRIHENWLPGYMARP